jgi:carbon storage regulator CsrA
MLVLSRKVGERIFIGENVMIEVRRVAGNRVTIALEAPRSVRILRGELEQAAREFDQPVENGHVETPCVMTPGRTLQGLPPELVGRDAVV